MDRRFLTEVYGLRDRESVRRLYDDWSASYDAELAENAYATPARVAAALAGTGTPTDARVLDFGCGTGLSGEALVAQGYTLIDGTDLSREMLSVAEVKQIYGRLWQTDAEGPLPVLPGDYGAIVAVGVVSPGAAPAATLADLAALLETGGRLAFSFNDHALADPDFVAAAGALEPRMRCLWREHGDHLPGIGLGATVHVYEVT